MKSSSVRSLVPSDSMSLILAAFINASAIGSPEVLGESVSGGGGGGAMVVIGCNGGGTGSRAPGGATTSNLMRFASGSTDGGTDDPAEEFVGKPGGG